MKNILKVIVALGVFTMTIGSSFAMDTNPPTEPVKTTAETEVVINDLEQPPVLEEGYGYKDNSGNCFYLGATPPLTDCHPENTGIICSTYVVEFGDIRDLYHMSRDNENSPWICGDLLKKPIVN